MHAHTTQWVIVMFVKKPCFTREEVDKENKKQRFALKLSAMKTSLPCRQTQHFHRLETLGYSTSYMITLRGVSLTCAQIPDRPKQKDTHTWATHTT